MIILAGMRMYFFDIVSKYLSGEHEFLLRGVGKLKVTVLFPPDFVVRHSMYLKYTFALTLCHSKNFLVI